MIYTSLQISFSYISFSQNSSKKRKNMRGYAKFKGNNSFSQNSKFKKEYPFLDVDFDDAYSSKPQENEQKPNIIKDDKKKKNSFFVENSDEHVDEEAKNEGERYVEGVLRRNYTISSSSTSSSLAYQKNGKSENLERQSSRKAIQKAVKRAFSTRRSCSVNSSRYCRIYDQPKNVRDFDYNNNNNHDHDVYDYGNNESLVHNRRHDQDNDDDNDDEYEIESNDGSMETNYTSLKKNKDDYEINNNNSNGKVKVGSKVAKACKRLFSR